MALLFFCILCLIQLDFSLSRSLNETCVGRYQRDPRVAGIKQALPRLAEDRWHLMCQMVRDLGHCVNQSDDAREERIKFRAQKIVPKVLDIACDEEIASKFACFTNVTNSESPICQSECGPYVTPLLSHLATLYPENEPFGRQHADRMCKFIRCRLICHKSDFIDQCGMSGYEAIKKLVRLLGTLVQVLGDTLRPEYEYLLSATECRPDRLMQGT